MDIGTLLTFVAIVIGPLVWVMMSHSNMNREMGELAKDVEHNSRDREIKGYFGYVCRSLGKT